MKRSLAAIFASHRGNASDKWLLYVNEYARLFAKYRARQIRLLEIGVQNGGSLDIWAAYFDAARVVVGCDIDPRCAEVPHTDARIRVLIGAAGEDAARDAIVAVSPGYDIVIDDGSHTSADICKAFARYFPLLPAGSLYIVEDVHCSYWLDFEGGLFHPFSAMAFFKRLADIVNHEHWGVPRDRRGLIEGFAQRYGFAIDEETLANVHSVEFVNSLCVIRRELPEANTLGVRVVSGTVEHVRPGHLSLRGSAPPVMNQSTNPWSTPTRPPEEEAPERLAQLQEAQQRDAIQMDQLRAELHRSLGRADVMAAARQSRNIRHRRLRYAMGERIARLREDCGRARDRSAELERTLAVSDAQFVAVQQPGLQLESESADAENERQALRMQAEEAFEVAVGLRKETAALLADAAIQQNRERALLRAIEARNERVAELNRVLSHLPTARWRAGLKRFMGGT